MRFKFYQSETNLDLPTYRVRDYNYLDSNFAFPILETAKGNFRKSSFSNKLFDSLLSMLERQWFQHSKAMFHLNWRNKILTQIVE